VCTEVDRRILQIRGPVLCTGDVVVSRMCGQMGWALFFCPAEKKKALPISCRVCFPVWSPKLGAFKSWSKKCDGGGQGY
jgi:hypothetical protein